MRPPAWRLFAERAYANTSIQQIATESGVAVQTIYSSVGSKVALVLALNDLIDEESGGGRPAGELHLETESAQLLAKGVRITRQLNGRCGDLIRVLLSAESAEPDVAAAVADGMQRHRQGATGLAHQLAKLGALQTSMTPSRAADVVSMLTSPSNWRHLTEDARWSFDDAEAWLTESLAQLLLRKQR